MEISPLMPPPAPNFTPLPPTMSEPPMKESFFSKIKTPNMLIIIIIVAVLFIISVAAYFFTRPDNSQAAVPVVPAAQPTSAKEVGVSAINAQVASSEGDVSDVTVSSFDSDLKDVKTDLQQL